MLTELDQDLFRLINEGLGHPALDLFFPFWTDVQKTLPFYVAVALVLSFLIYRKNLRVLVVIFSCALGAFVSDLLNAQVLKPLFERPRPSAGILRTDFHGSFSFPSSHAVDMFFIAMFLSLFYPRFRIVLFSLAFLTALSRVYCGVHYPGDILGGAAVGMLLAWGGHKLTERLMTAKLKSLTALLLILVSSLGWAYEDPTQKKPFFPWVWEEELKPTFKKTYDEPSLWIIGTGAVSVLAVHQYDGKIYDFSTQGGNLLIGEETAKQFGKLGNGAASVSLIAAQVLFDTPNGVNTAKAFMLTSLSHVSLSALARRNRPENKTDFLPFPSSFPSGHTSSAFAVAGSMAYSYGWKGGVPGYLLASAIGLSRIKEKRHWASDVVGGAFLGTFWARASFSPDETDKEGFTVVPVPVYDGFMISATRDF